VVVVVVGASGLMDFFTFSSSSFEFRDIEEEDEVAFEATLILDWGGRGGKEVAGAGLAGSCCP
jgi:hypothetical protein